MGNLLKFTASYANCRHNFVVANMPSSNKKQPMDVYKYTSIIKNILQRSPVVKPSKFLLSKVGGISENITSPYYLYNEDAEYTPNWINTVLGSDEGDNPAYDFFYKKLVEFIPELSWIRQFILPEAFINDILKIPDARFNDQRVDFYLPMAKLVVEIDGIQHEKDMAQIVLDSERDKKLNAEGIHVIRIPVKILKQKRKSEELKRTFTDIKDLIVKCLDYEKILLQKNADRNILNKKVQYDEIMRFEILLLSLIENNVLCLSDEQWVLCVEKEKRYNFELAYYDVILWYGYLFQLKGVMFSRPKIVWKKDSKIKIYSRMYERYDDSENQGIGIFTDYLDDNDYFFASSCEAVNYNISFPIDKKRKSALLFFLKNMFDYEAFKPGQVEIIINALNLHTTIGILPTGSGKSLCYFYACLLQPGINIAVCPIISLLQDQKKNCDDFGITRTSFVSSGQDSKEKENIISNFGSLKYLMLWVAPERFQMQKFREQLNKINTSAHIIYAVIDEVHCLSEWGHDFRTSYLTLIQTIKRFCHNTKLIGLTATASQAVLQDLKIEFNVDGSDVKALSSLERNNLCLSVIKCNENNKLKHLKHLLIDKQLARKNNIGIIFALSTGDKSLNGCVTIAESIAKDVAKRNAVLNVFSGALDKTKKSQIQEEFMNDGIDLLVATKAFGMGVNKNNVRYTIHYGMPWSIEAFYQEAGRAGRDGKKSECYILYEMEDSNAEENIDKLFSPNLDCGEIPDILKQKTISYDLNTMFYLWGQGNKGIKKDVEDVEKVISSFKRSKKEVLLESTKELSQADIQRVLYRLKILGVVDDWLIVQFEFRKKGKGGDRFFRPGIIKTCLSDEALNKKRIFEYLYGYIQKYSRKFGKSKNDDKYLTILKNKNLTILRRCVTVLVEWTYDYIIYSRRRMMYNMLNLCANYTDTQSFNQKISDYLKISESTVILDNVINDPDNWELWTELLFEKSINPYQEEIQTLLTNAGLESLRMTISRYLESYRDNAGINLIYALSGLMLGEYNKTIDGDILKQACEDMQQIHGIAFCWKWLIELIAERRADIDDIQLEEFLEIALQKYPDTASYSYNKLKDEVSLKYGLINAMNKINETLEEKYG